MMYLQKMGVNTTTRAEIFRTLFGMRFMDISLKNIAYYNTVADLT